MTLQEALKVLEYHQKWRKGDDNIEQTNPKELTEAINVAIEVSKRLGKKRIKMKQGKITIRKVGDKTYEIQTESTLQSIISDIVSFIAVYLILSEFLGKSLVFDLLAVGLVLAAYALFKFGRSRYLTKDELIEELKENE